MTKTGEQDKNFCGRLVLHEHLTQSRGFGMWAAVGTDQTARGTGFEVRRDGHDIIYLQITISRCVRMDSSTNTLRHISSEHATTCKATKFATISIALQISTKNA